MVFCGNQYKGAGFPGTSTYHKLRTGQRPWPTKEIPCVIRPSGQCAKPGRSSGSPMGTGNSYGRLQRPNQAQRFIIRVVSCRKDGNRNYVKPWEAVWLYARRYEDGTIKYLYPMHQIISRIPSWIGQQRCVGRLNNALKNAEDG